MVRALGIGGFFFRGKDPAALAAWYERHFEIAKMGDYGDPGWTQDAGPTVFTPFPDDTDYFGRPDQSWMINFRVADLDAAVADFRADGLAVEVEVLAGQYLAALAIGEPPLLTEQQMDEVLAKMESPDGYGSSPEPD